MKLRLRSSICVVLATAALVLPAGSAHAQVAAPGYAVTNWVTNMSNNGAVGPVGVAADPNSPDDIYVMNYATGLLYKFNAAIGGVQDAAHQVSTSNPYGSNNAAGIAFDKQGRLYVALQQSARLWEISKIDGHFIRELNCAGCSDPTGLATDPLSGDLFVTNPGSGVTLRIRTDGFSLGVYTAANGLDGITFGPDGTLWGARLATSPATIVKIDGTNTATPGQFVTVATVVGGDGISIAAAPDDPAFPPFIFVNDNFGNVIKVDLTSGSAVYTTVVTGGTRGDFSTVGFDGCLYATQTDRVIKVTNADGTCSLAPVTPDDVTALTLTINPGFGAYHDMVTVGGTLTNVSKNQPLEGKAVTFTIGAASCTATTNANGEAACSLTLVDPSALTTLTAHFDHETKLAAATATAPFVIGKAPTSVVYVGDVSGHYGSPVRFAAIVFSSAGPPVGAAVSFTLGSVQSSPVGQSCAGTTDSNGEASCTVVVNEPSGNWVIRATVIGNDFYDVSSTSATFTISVPPPTMTYTGATAGDYNDPAALSATLSDTGLPVAGAQLTFVLGTQACTAVTNASGAASCNVTPNVGAGTYPLAVSFAGTANILPSSTSATFTVTREETSLAYTGVSGPVGAGSTVTLSAVLKEDGVSAIGGRTVTLSFGAQTCSASTNAAGLASCTVTVSQPTGPVGITASFAGDTFYQPATASSDALVYGSAGGGAFVIGDGSAAGAVMFWGAQWSRANALSGRAASPSFKGYATAAAGPACGATWTTGPGNSPPPPATIPQYIAVIVASSTAKNGPAISGNTVSVVIVRTNPGYGPDPSQTGTGTVVATICH